MFSRAPNAAHICLRCQLRLRRPDRPLTKAPFPLPTPAPRRRQSALASRVDDHDVSPERHEPDLTDPNPPKVEATKKKKRHKISTVWRPSPTAHLGMNALGKPSEVLLLPARDRKFPIVPNDDNEESKEDFYESLASEKQPSTWEQIKENIDQARTQIPQRRGPLTAQSWVDLKGIMIEGFTLNQLRRYWEETSPTELHSKYRKTAGKEPIIKLIAKHVWHYEMPIVPLQSTQQTKTSNLDILTQTPCTKNHLTAIERHPIHNLHKLAREHAVQIILDRQQRAVISGPIEQARTMLKVLREWTSSMKDTFRKLKGHTRSLQDLMATGSFKILVETLACKYGAHAAVKRREDEIGLKILSVAANRDVDDRIEHEVYLATECGKDKLRSITDQDPKDRSLMMPYYSPETAALYPYRENMHRLVSAGTTKAISEQAVESVWESVHTELFEKGPVMEQPFQQRYEYCAEFGVALFDKFDGSRAVQVGVSQPESGRFKAKAMNSIFAPEIPLVSTLFPSSNMQLKSHLEAPGISVRLSFRCHLSNDPGHLGRIIEVWLAGANNRAGLAQDLQIQRIFFLEGEKSLNLLCPSLPVDIKVTRRCKTEVYLSESPQPSNIFTAISTYISRLGEAASVQGPDADFVPSPHYPLFLEVPISLYATRIAFSEHDKVGGKDAKGASPMQNVHFFLSDLSIVDADEYNFKHRRAQYRLEHINYIAQNPNANPKDPAQKYIMPSPFRDRQTLIMKDEINNLREEVPKKRTKGKKAVMEKERFEKFYRAAIWVANEFGEEAKRFKRRMERMK